MGEAREEGARRPSIKGEAKDELIRFVRDTRSEKNAQPLNIYQGRSRRRGCDVCMCGCA